MKQLKNKYMFSIINKPKINIIDSNIGKRFYSSISYKKHLFFPAVIYQNAETDKRLIFKENINKSGVYRWTNLTNNKSYIGSSIKLNQRFSSYYSFKSISDQKKNSLIYKALLKFEYSNFKLEILEYCEPLKVIEREQYFIDLFKPEYNICKTASSTLGRKMTEKTKIILLAVNKGRKLTKEHRKKLVIL